MPSKFVQELIPTKSSMCSMRVVYKGKETEDQRSRPSSRENKEQSWDPNPVEWCL